MRKSWASSGPPGHLLPKGEGHVLRFFANLDNSGQRQPYSWKSVFATSATGLLRQTPNLEGTPPMSSARPAARCFLLRRVLLSTYFVGIHSAENKPAGRAPEFELPLTPAVRSSLYSLKKYQVHRIVNGTGFA